MSDMTGIQREAMRRAMRGAWALADAIEVLARQSTAAPFPLICGLQEGGRLRYFAYGDALASDACPLCEGRGKEADGADCEDCGGIGSRLHIDTENYEGDILLVENMNGDVLFDAAVQDELPNLAYGHPIGTAKAQLIVDAYLYELAHPKQSIFNIPEAA